MGRLTFRRILVLGLVAIVGGIGLFGYVIFIYPGSDPPGEPLPGSTSREGQPPAVVSIDRNGFCSLGLRFRYDTTQVRTSQGEPCYLVTAKAKVVDEKGTVLLDRVVKLRDDESFSQGTPKSGMVGSGDLIHFFAVAEHRLTDVFPVRPGMRLTATVEFTRPDSDTGTGDQLEWYLTALTCNTQARHAFRVNMPTYGLAAAGIGIVLFLLGVIGTALSPRR